MRYILTLLSALSLLSTGCAVVRVSSTPVQTSSAIYATSADYTLERQLDLQAVVAAFAQSSNVEEFEYRINNSYNVVSNLDLNMDGYIDYLRVLETREGRSHVFLIQAVLGNSYFQDVATLIVDNPYLSNCVVEIVGSPFIYGRSYVLRPVYVQRPRIFNYLCSYTYRPWRSPWYWHHYPRHYNHCRHYTYSYYSSCVTTYMTRHSYCHQVTRYDVCHYSSYERVIVSDTRNDYGNQYPQHSFSTRNAETPERGTSAVERAENARREQQQSASDSRSTSTADSKSTTTSSGSRSTSATSGSRSSSTTSGSRSASTTSGSRSTSTTTSRSSSSSAGSRNGSSTSSRSTSGTSGSRSATTTSGSRSTSTTTSRSSSSSAGSRNGSSTSSRSSSGTSGSRSASTSSGSRSSSTTSGSRSSSSSRQR
ncbi:MAG: hypothetical protein MJY92_06170 [Bacteroidales bacterium]|nr:hypothetical protein [Bacteroidales bacterium]